MYAKKRKIDMGMKGNNLERTYLCKLDLGSRKPNRTEKWARRRALKIRNPITWSSDLKY